MPDDKRVHFRWYRSTKCHKRIFGIMTTSLGEQSPCMLVRYTDNIEETTCEECLTNIIMKELDKDIENDPHS